MSMNEATRIMCYLVDINNDLVEGRLSPGGVSSLALEMLKIISIEPEILEQKKQEVLDALAQPNKEKYDSLVESTNVLTEMICMLVKTAVENPFICKEGVPVLIPGPTYNIVINPTLELSCQPSTN